MRDIFFFLLASSPPGLCFLEHHHQRRRHRSSHLRKFSTSQANFNVGKNEENTARESIVCHVSNTQHTHSVLIRCLQLSKDIIHKNNTETEISSKKGSAMWHDMRKWAFEYYHHEPWRRDTAKKTRRFKKQNKKKSGKCGNLFLGVFSSFHFTRISVCRVVVSHFSHRLHLLVSHVLI